ncbi:hypothetical protein B5S30_g3782 [[Candida] boidinii]|nr:hypothetical protein B5S30_g3782 [[Candida] boidinii]GMG05197.1 unnamed protein product [[Candida] boidinii]
MKGKQQSANQQAVLETEDQRLKQKCKDLKQKIIDIENQNEITTLAISRSKISIKRLRFEYLLLLENLEKNSIVFNNYLNNNNEFIDKINDVNFIDEIDNDLLLNNNNIGSDLSDITKFISTNPMSRIKKILNEFSKSDQLSILKNSINGLNNNQLNTNNLSSTNSNGLIDSNNSNQTLSNKGKGKRGGPGALKKARIKDPTIPKRPTNAYLIFCEMEKEKLKKEIELKNPGVSVDLSRAMTDAWKKLDEESRKPYYELYERDRARYHREIEEYNFRKSGGVPSKPLFASSKTQDASVISPKKEDGSDEKLGSVSDQTESTPIPEDSIVKTEDDKNNKRALDASDDKEDSKKIKLQEKVDAEKDEAATTTEANDVTEKAKDEPKEALGESKETVKEETKEVEPKNEEPKEETKEEEKEGAKDASQEEPKEALKDENSVAETADKPSDTATETEPSESATTKE